MPSSAFLSTKNYWFSVANCTERGKSSAFPQWKNNGNGHITGSVWFQIALRRTPIPEITHSFSFLIGWQKKLHTICKEMNCFLNTLYIDTFTWHLSYTTQTCHTVKLHQPENRSNIYIKVYGVFVQWLDIIHMYLEKSCTQEEDNFFAERK